MIELARDVDRAEINRLARQVHALHIQWRPDLYTMPEELFPEELFLALVKDKELYAAKIDGNVVGFAWIRMRQSEGVGLVPRKVMLVNQVCVDEALRNHGIGTQIMEEIRVLAKAFGCTELLLSVYPQNDAAVSFYQKCGFMIQNIHMQQKI